ncbi:hypothetical protein XELAEV_18004393mg [Xenopus laevis]|uniref:Uncharacterized protein n=1 Tax=Xenopus laevis TaxID=8355 RepID=A0A974BPL6_XENLA|nr:hypothetical protein XELAEV_18004393mg [Xenopus laevis]
MELLQDFLTGAHERHGGDEADALGHKQSISGNVVGVEALQFGYGAIVAVLGAVSAVARRRVDDVILGVMHVVQGLHGAANLLAGDFLKEGEREAKCPRAIFSCDDERVVLCLSGVGLSLKR